MCVYVHVFFFVYDKAQRSSDMWNIFHETQDSIGKLKIILYQERFVQSQAPFVETFTGIDPCQKKSHLEVRGCMFFFKRFQFVPIEHQRPQIVSPIQGMFHFCETLAF